MTLLIYIWILLINTLTIKITKMKYNFFTILILLISYISNSEITYPYLSSDEFLSIYFIIVFLSLLLICSLFIKGDKYKFLFILILIINMVFILANIRFLIGSIHVLD